MGFTDPADAKILELVIRSEKAEEERDKLLAQNRRMLEALQNMTGLFGEAVIRHQMGKAFTDLHADAVRSAKDALTKYAENQPELGTCRWCDKGWVIKEIRKMHEAPDTGELAKCEA